MQLNAVMEIQLVDLPGERLFAWYQSMQCCLDLISLASGAAEAANPDKSEVESILFFPHSRAQVGIVRPAGEIGPCMSDNNHYPTWGEEKAADQVVSGCVSKPNR